MDHILKTSVNKTINTQDFLNEEKEINLTMQYELQRNFIVNVMMEE